MRYLNVQPFLFSKNLSHVSSDLPLMRGLLTSPDTRFPIFILVWNGFQIQRSVSWEITADL